MTFQVGDIIPGEAVKLETEPTARALLPAFLLSWLIIPFFWGLWWYFAQIRSRTYTVTNERIFSSRIFLRKDNMTTKLVDVSDVRLHQGIWGRLLDFGTVTVISFSGQENRLQAVRQPEAVKTTVIALARNKQAEAKRITKVIGEESK